MADNSYGIWIISFLLVGILGMAFLTTINDAISTTTTPTAVAGETLANYGENTVTNTPLHAVTSVYTALTSTALTGYTIVANVINLNTDQASTLELVAPHAEAAGYWSFNVNNSTNTVDDANGLNNGTLGPGSASIINETFNSSTYDTPVQLAHTDLVADSVFVTTVDGGTNYTETTNYTIDYTAGTITTLSTGDMAENTNYYIDYNYSDSLPTWTDAGQYGGAYDFDGVDDYIIIPSSESMNITENITISIWTRIKELKPMELVAKNSYHSHYEFAIDENLKLTMNWRAPSVQVLNSDTLTTDYINTWTHFAITVNCVEGEGKFYINGILNSTDTTFNTSQCIGTYAPNTGTATRIGLRSTSIVGHNGTIDDVRIYNRSLSAEEIKEIYDTYMNTSVYKADYTYEQSGYVEGTSSNLLWLIPTFLLLSLLVLFWRLADQGA